MKQASLQAAEYHVLVVDDHDAVSGADNKCRLCVRYRRAQLDGDLMGCSHGAGFRGVGPKTDAAYVSEIILDILEMDGSIWTDQIGGWPGGAIGSAFSRLRTAGFIKATGRDRTSLKRSANGRAAYEWVMM
jgi:hypothetical protein